VLLLSGLLSALSPFVILPWGYGLGWDNHHSWYPVVAYFLLGLTGFLVLLPPLNLYLLVRYRPHGARSLISHLVTYAGFLINLLGSLFVGKYLLWLLTPLVSTFLG